MSTERTPLRSHTRYDAEDGAVLAINLNRDLEQSLEIPQLPTIGARTRQPYNEVQALSEDHVPSVADFSRAYEAMGILLGRMSNLGVPERTNLFPGSPNPFDDPDHNLRQTNEVASDILRSAFVVPPPVVPTVKVETHLNPNTHKRTTTHNIDLIKKENISINARDIQEKLKDNLPLIFCQVQYGVWYRL